MTKKEYMELSERMMDIYAGILFNNQVFDDGDFSEIVYDFDCSEFVILKEKYKLEEIAGKGSDFRRAKRLLHYLAPRLYHSSWYDNHVPCNALDLLEYSFEDPEHGINCLNKAKILEECCLAVGIYGRRVRIMPYSPYDFDNHVVTEIYDRQLEKWIMLDPTTDGFFVDENGLPLSLLEIRDKFARAEFVTFVRSTDSLKDLNKLKEKYVNRNSYICKNLFYFYVDKASTFGDKGEFLAFVPKGYSVKEKQIANVEYRIKNLPEDLKELIPNLEIRLEALKKSEEEKRTDIESMRKAPMGIEKQESQK